MPEHIFERGNVIINGHIAPMFRDGLRTYDAIDGHDVAVATDMNDYQVVFVDTSSWEILATVPTGIANAFIGVQMTRKKQYPYPKPERELYKLLWEMLLNERIEG